MDWNQFFKDNSQALIAFGGVLIGLLFGFINNVFQARERQRDRQERLRESRIELDLDIVRNHVKTLQNVIDNNLQSLDIVSIAWMKGQAGLISQEEMVQLVQSQVTAGDSAINELNTFDAVAYKIAYRLGDELALEYFKFKSLWTKYMNCIMVTPSLKEERELYKQFLRDAGKLQKMLDEKLLAIRNDKPEQSTKTNLLVYLSQITKRASKSLWRLE